MNSFIYDLRYGWRQLWRNPGFTLISVLCLGVGIGACAAIFSVADALLFNPFSFDHERYVIIKQRSADWARDQASNVSGPWADHWAAHAQTLEAVVPTQTSAMVFAGGDKPVEVVAGRVPAEFFRFMQTPVLLGSGFSKDQQAEGQNRVVVLTHGFWQRQFGGSPDVIGQKVSLAFDKYTVIGVAEPTSSDALRFDVAIPMNVDGLKDQSWGRHDYRVFAKLKPGVTPQQAEEELNALAQPLIERWPSVVPPLSLVVPMAEDLTRDVRPLILILSVAVSFVLLIACANVANLLISKGVSRRHEVAVRTALGAGRARLVRQLLTENMVLTSLGGVLGVLVAAWGIDMLVWLLGDTSGRNHARSTMIQNVGVSPAVLGVCIGLSVLTGLLVGLLPALSISRFNLGQSMKEAGTRSTERGGQRWLRASLVSGEIALAFVLLVGAAVSAASFSRLSNADLGIEHEPVFSAKVNLPEVRYNQASDRVRFTQELLSKLQALPGAEAVGITEKFVFSRSNSMMPYRIDPNDVRPPEDTSYVQYQQVTPGFFEVMGLSLLAGRDLQDGDQQANRIVVNERFAEQNWPGQNPIGLTLYLPQGQQGFAPFEVVGLVSSSRRKIGRENEPLIYRPLGFFENIHIAVKTQRDVADMARAVEALVWSIDPALAVADIDTLRLRIQHETASSRVSMLLMNTLSTIALLSAAIGIYGVMSFNVNQGRRDIAIRMALGARSWWVMQSVLGRGLALTGIGLVVGVAVAIVLLGLFGDQVFEIDPINPSLMLGVSLGLAGIATIACFIPAWRATRIQPMELLRDE